MSLFLASSFTATFASPDETAVAVSLRQIVETGSVAIPEPLAPSIPWLHPRSYIASGQALLPVGFLGWPWWLAQVYRLLPLTWVAVFASLLCASGCIPWYFLLKKRFGVGAAWWGTILAWTFPPVLLYLNRSFFSHIPQLTTIFWGVWLLSWLSSVSTVMKQRERWVMQLIAGILLGAGLSFRPIEAFWLVPMILLVWWQSVPRIEWKKQVVIVCGVVLGLLPLFIMQAYAYGAWFQVGYWVQANADPLAIEIPQLAASQQARPWYAAFAPYGIHPRTVWWNVRWFFLSFLAPWSLTVGVIFLAFLMRYRTQAREKAQVLLRRRWGTVLVVGGFFGWILTIYGSGFYLDHVRSGAVTVGNSFLRYTLPFGFAYAWLCAWVYAYADQKSVSLRRIYAGGAMLLVVFGVYSAFFRDEEGMWATRRELVRYQAIREAARREFGPSDIILSERSDKIFFPVVRVVSPLPTDNQIKALTQFASTTKLGLFARPLSLRERDAWRQMGYDVHELGVFGRERLYRLTPFLR